jgi:SAM-dependent MidA family methyltransferase
VAGDSAGHPELLLLIRDEIRASGPISFARFMDVALHHEAHGYYARGPVSLGTAGDFYTASDVGPAFGTCLARQLVDFDAALGRPERFDYVECGAGRGLNAADVASAVTARAPDLARRLALRLVDRSPGMQTAIAARVPAAKVEAAPSPANGTGCVVAIELLDALPVHRVRRRAGALRELAVGLEGDRLVEVEREPGEAVRAYAEAYAAAPNEGDEAEIGLALGPAVAGLAAAIGRGFVLVVDYGHDAARMYGPRHRRGTLLAYHRHRAHEDYLAHVGQQDLTAHVNLTALTDRAREAGLTMVGRATQERFLLAHGILDGLDDAGDDDREAVKRRLQAKQLLHPLGMGRAFTVVLFSKGLGSAPALPGWARGGPP